MSKDTFDNLTPRQKERLEKWRQNTLPVKSAEVLAGSSWLHRRKSPGNFVPRRKETCDDFRDFEQDLHPNRSP